MKPTALRAERLPAASVAERGLELPGFWRRFPILPPNHLEFAPAAPVREAAPLGSRRSEARLDAARESAGTDRSLAGRGTAG